MARIGVVAALVVAAIFAMIIVLDREPEARPGKPLRPPPARLQESEVRTYLEVMPRYWEILREAVQNMESARPRIEALLRRHHLDLRSWRRLQQRVEFVVNVIRWEGRKEERDAELREKIAELEELRETVDGEDRERVDEQIERYETLQEAEGAPLHPEDRELVKRFWTELDRLAAGTPSELRRRPPR